MQRQHRQYYTRTYNSGTTDWYCFFRLFAAIVVRLFAQHRDSCARVVLWSCFINEAFCNCPLGYSRGIFFHLLRFFRACFSWTNPGWICMKHTKTRAVQTRTCDACAHLYTCIYDMYMLHVHTRTWYTRVPGIWIQQWIKDYSSVVACMWWVHK